MLTENELSSVDDVQRIVEQRAAKAERAAIVAWLRSSAWSVVEAANAIERGDHLKEKRND